MEIRQKDYGVGSVVRLKECHAYPLPAGIAEGTVVTVVERYTGGARVRGDDGTVFAVAMQNINSGWDVNLNGQWLDERDRRVIKEQRRLERAGLALRRVN